MAQYPANINLASLDGSNGFKLGGDAGERCGSAVASAGDVNGDGLADLIVGASDAAAPGHYSGASYVVFARASGFGPSFNLSTLDGSNGFKLGGATGSHAGFTLASAGDVNGDGFADVIVGAPFALYGGQRTGASYVVFGRAGGFAANIDLAGLDGRKGFKLGGVAGRGYSGWSVSSAGDVNGDGFDDVIVGTFPGYAHRNEPGTSYVVFGKASGFAANLDLSTLDGSNGFRIRGRAAGDTAGVSVASAGDVNGDGIADLIVGASGVDLHGSYTGASYVVFGKTSGFAASLEVAALDGSNGFRLIGEAAGDYSGWSVSSAGDVNGDGFADMIVGSRLADPHGERSGASYVVFGKASFAASFDLSKLKGSNGFKLSGAAAYDYTGLSVASAGDVNGDGFSDIIVGAHGADAQGASSGTSYVVFGKASGFAANIDLSTLDGSNGFRLRGASAGDESGRSVASAGDVNGDGLDDLIVGAPESNANGERSGASYVIYGRAPDTAVNRVGTVASQTLAGGAFDDTLSGLGGGDRLFGNAGNDTLDGGLGDDRGSGGDGNDLLRGREGNDLLSGGNGDDELLGAEGNDVIDGGSGKDTLAGGEGDDSLDGGKGIDTVRYVSASAGVSVDLALTGAQDTGGAGIDTLRNLENVVGSAFGDRLWGSDGANVLTGGEGDDVLIGRKGDDVLDGGGGADRLNGGAGANTLTGGDGNDRFVFDSPLVAGVITTITDLSAGADTVALGSTVFTKVGPVGPLAANRFFIGSEAHDSKDRIIYNAASGALLYDPDGTGSQAATQFAIVTPGLALTASDFKVI